MRSISIERIILNFKRPKQKNDHVTNTLDDWSSHECECAQSRNEKKNEIETYTRERAPDCSTNAVQTEYLADRTRDEVDDGSLYNNN